MRPTSIQKNGGNNKFIKITEDKKRKKERRKKIFGLFSKEKAHVLPIGYKAVSKTCNEAYMPKIGSVQVKVSKVHRTDLFCKCRRILNENIHTFF